MRVSRFYFKAGKRIFDLLLATFGLLTLAPVIVVVALFVILTSGRPILFRQARVGQFGQLFYINKFRTMTNRREPGSSVTTSCDARITPIGKWLRKLKLDELPQLFNVLVGEMSFVGPRPDVPSFADRLEGESRKILDLRPGITGPATLYFRNEEEILALAPDPEKYNRDVIFPEKVRLNLEYCDSCTFAGDLLLIFRTVIPWL